MHRFQHAKRCNFRTLGCLVTGLCWLSATGAYGDDAIYTKDNTFYIPYSVSTEPNGPPPSQIELFVSGDKGATWQLYAKQAPVDDNRFAFRAAVDGEFWFSVRTISADGQPDKAEVTSPELIVIVDQQPPRLDVTASATDQNVISLHWKVSDIGADASTLKIEYRDAPTDVWMAVQSSAAQPNAYGDEFQGTASWAVAAGVNPVEIQATVRDKAGNETVVERSVPLADTSAVAQTPDIPWPQPSLNNLATRENKGWQPSDEFNEPGDLLPQPNGPVGSMLPLTMGQIPDANLQIGQHPPVQDPSVTNPMTNRNERVSRSQRFQLEYEIEGVNAIAVHRVEIWATHDNGQTWRHLGDDDDKQSPYLVSVPNDGIFGFRLLVQAQEGLPVRPPLSGDLPDVWVRVDSTMPNVRLTNARYGRGAELGQLAITWNASDDDLKQTPVTLLFGESPDGPWRIAAEELPNTGSYRWVVDDRIPNELYLRVEVQDRAGNIGNDTLRNPIRSDGLVPKGTIRNVRPASHTQPAYRPQPAIGPMDQQPSTQSTHRPTAQTRSFTDRMRSRLRL